MSPQDKIRSISADTILLAVEPEQVFGLFTSPRPHWTDDLEIVFRALARVWHPDRSQDPAKSKSVTQALLALRDRATQKIAAGTYGAVMSVTIKSNKATLKPDTVEVLRRHIAVLESRQSNLRAISLAISDAMRELWWSAGTDARRRIERVGELALEIRNEDAITVEPVILAGANKPQEDQTKAIVRGGHK